MNYSEWRKTRVESLTLPSGLEVKVKRPSLLALVMNGDIPQTLLPELDNLLAKPADAKIQMSEVKAFGDIARVIVRASIVEPPIADVSDEEHLAVSDLDDGDLTFLFKWSNASAQALQPFRQE